MFQSPTVGLLLMLVSFKEPPLGESMARPRSRAIDQQCFRDGWMVRSNIMRVPGEKNLQVLPDSTWMDLVYPNHVAGLAIPSHDVHFPPVC